MRYSHPRLRIVLIHRPNSNFNSIFEVSKTGRDFQYRPDSHVSLNPSFCFRRWIISRQSVFATSYRTKLFQATSVFGHEILSNFNNTYKSCFLTEFTHFVFWWKRFNLLNVLLPYSLIIHGVFVLQRNFGLNFAKNNWLTHQYHKFTRSILMVPKFFACSCHCSVDTLESRIRCSSFFFSSLFSFLFSASSTWLEGRQLAWKIATRREAAAKWRGTNRTIWWLVPFEVSIISGKSERFMDATTFCSGPTLKLQMGKILW